MNTKRNFESELMHELKFHVHCTQKAKDPQHFCYQNELAKNLKMSLRDVGKTLHTMVEEHKLIRESIVHKSKRRDKFTPLDPSLLSSKDIITKYKSFVDNELDHLNDFSKQVKKTPCVYNVRRIKNDIPVFKVGTNQKPVQMVKPTSTTGKNNAVGFQLMTSFCDQCNRIFTYCDSLNYSQLADIISQDNEHIEMINTLRKYALNKIVKEIRFVLSGLAKYQREVIESQILTRIPTVYHVIQIEKSSKLKISDF